MEQIEQTQRMIASAQVQLKDSETLFSKEKAVLDEKDRVLAAELTELEAQQKELSGRVEKGLLARYNKLKATRKDQALALIRMVFVSGAGSRCRLTDFSGQTRGTTSIPAPIVIECCIGKVSLFQRESALSSKTRRRILSSANPSRCRSAPAVLF